jgi:anti-sigma B factor antagonist
VNLEYKTQDGVDIVNLPERFLMANASAYRAPMIEVIEQGSGKLIVNLSITEFMDSTGLGVLVSLLKAARNRGGDIVLCNMSNTVRALFELTRLHTVFKIFDEESGALRTFS